MGLADGWAALDRLGFQAVTVLLTVLWQSSILLAAAGALALLLRRRRASVRHAVWVAALLMIPALPVLGWLASSASAPQAPIPVMPAYPSPRLPVEAPVRDEAEGGAPSAPVAAPFPAAGPPAPPEPRSFGLLAYPWALALAGYAAGALFFLSLVLVGRLRIGRWARRGRIITSPRVLGIFRAARHEVGAAGDLTVVESAGAASPMTVGWLHPVILLPAGFTESLADTDLRAVAIHESAHVRRRDPLLLALLSFVRAALYFHPLVWLACRQVSLLAESACDDTVLEATAEPVSYARLLARLAEELPRRPLAIELAAGFVFSKGAFLRRIEAILSDRRDQIRRLSRWTLAVTLVAALVSVALAVALPLGEKADDGPSAAADDVAATLMVALENSDAAERTRAAIALGKVKPTAATVAALTQALDDAMWFVRGRAAESLGALGPAAAAAVPALRKAMNDKEKSVGAKAARAIERIRPGKDEPATGGDERKPPVWVSLLARSPIRSLEQYHHTFRTDPPPAPPLYKPVPVPACDLEIRRAGDQQRVARLPYVGYLREHREFDQSDRRRIGDLPDGGYLLALVVGDVRCSNVAEFEIRSAYDPSKERPLRLVALEPGPGGAPRYLGLRGTGPTPEDPQFDTVAVHCPNLTVEGVEHRVKQIVGSFLTVGPGRQAEAIVDLQAYVPSIAPDKPSTVKARFRQYESNAVQLPADDRLARAWDAATPRLAPAPTPRVVLQGQVTGPDGKPGAGYEVWLAADNRNYREKCAADGRYAFVNVPAGRYQVGTTPPARGQPALTVEGVEVQAGQTVTRDLNMEAKFGFAGTVVFEDGAPAAGVEVMATWPSPDGAAEFGDFATVGPDGRYTVRSPYPEASYVGISMTGPHPEPKRGVKDGRTDVDFVMPRLWGNAVEGVQCRIHAEKPTWPQGSLPKFFVDLRNQGKRNLRIALESESWEFEIDGTWHKTHTGFSGLRKYVPLGPGQEQENLDVWIAGDLRGKLGALEPGKHTLRVARLIPYFRSGEDVLRVVSNPVQIEVVADKPRSDADKTAGPSAEVYRKQVANLVLPQKDDPYLPSQKWLKEHLAGAVPYLLQTRIQYKDQFNRIPAVTDLLFEAWQAGLLDSRQKPTLLENTLLVNWEMREAYPPGFAGEAMVNFRGVFVSKDMEPHEPGDTWKRPLGPEGFLKAAWRVELDGKEVRRGETGGSDGFLLWLPEGLQPGGHKVEAIVEVSERGGGWSHTWTRSSPLRIDPEATWSRELATGEPELKVVPAEPPGEGKQRGQADWGPAVDGVQCRLRAEKPTWPQGIVPTVKVDFRNRGTRNLKLVLGSEYWELQCDGIWYRMLRVNMDGRDQVLLLGPNQQHSDYALPLGDYWRSRDGGAPLVFAPGKHVICVAFQVHPAQRGDGPSVRVVSNPIEIQITGPQPDAAKDRPQEAVRGRVVDHEGKPVAGAAVYLAGSQALEWERIEAWQGKPPSVSGPTAQTGPQGGFALGVAGTPKNRLVIASPSLAVWVVPLPEPGTEPTIRLPAPATLKIRCDIPGAGGQAQFHLHLKTWQMEGWKGLTDGRQYMSLPVPNPGQTVLSNLTPGTYDLARQKNVRVGDYGMGLFCNARDVTLDGGQTVEAALVRGAGQPILGQVVGLKGTGVAGAFLFVKPAAATGDPRRERGLHLFEVLTCDVEGQFKIETLPPGDYTVVAEAYGPDLGFSGERLPDYVGAAKATVRAEGPAPQVRIEMKTLAEFDKAAAGSQTPPGPARRVP